MRIWLTQDGEPIPGVEPGTRPWRVAMLGMALANAGHEVLWWASTLNYVTRKFWFDRPTVRTIQPGFDVYMLHGPGYTNTRSLARLIHQRAVARQFREQSASRPLPDLIFASLPTLELVEQAVQLGRQHAIPVIVDIRDLWPDHYLTMAPKPLRPLLRVALHSEFRRAARGLNAATGITAITSTFLDWGLAKAGRPRGPDDTVFPMSFSAAHALPAHERPDAGDTVMPVVYAGTMGSTAYNFDTVIEAARRLAAAQRSDVTFVITGTGGQEARIRALADGLPNVRFTGWIAHNEVHRLLGHGAVGLACYQNGATIHGSMPNKMFEYMAAGVPLLSSMRGEMEAFLAAEQIGLTYESTDSESLLAQIQWFVERPAERRAMGQRARQIFLERFDASRVFPATVQHLEGVVERARQRQGVQ
jgi:glycosyltransferase involved in cell wall biosynthesis